MPPDRALDSDYEQANNGIKASVIILFLSTSQGSQISCIELLGEVLNVWLPATVVLLLQNKPETTQKL